MQLLYQIDLRGPDDCGLIADAARAASLGPDAFDPPGVVEAAWTLASEAWSTHEQADEMIGELTPDWPTHRQPPVDRAILRLGFYEMVSGRTPVKVAINEGVDLAKIYAGEQSPAFINGVLDKIARRLQAQGRIPAGTAPPSSSDAHSDPESGFKVRAESELDAQADGPSAGDKQAKDTWLHDALSLRTSAGAARKPDARPGEAEEEAGRGCGVDDAAC